MFHRWLSTDNGSQCFRCGLVLDYMTEDESGGNFAESVPNASEIAHALAPACVPSDLRAHHLVLTFAPPRVASQEWPYALECAYDDTVLTAESSPESYASECAGA